MGREGGGRGRHQQLAGPLPGGSWSVLRCRCSFPRLPALKFSPDYPCTQVKIQYITRAHRPGLPGPRQPRPCLPSSVPSCGQTSLVSQLPLPLALCASLCVKILPLPAHLTLGAREEHRPEDLSICHWSPQSPEPPCSSRSALFVADACLLPQALGPLRAGLPCRALPPPRVQEPQASTWPSRGLVPAQTLSPLLSASPGV